MQASLYIFSFRDEAVQWGRDEAVEPQKPVILHHDGQICKYCGTKNCL